jgi:hypothetical protein
MANPASSIKIGLRRDKVVRSNEIGTESRPDNVGMD